MRQPIDREALVRRHAVHVTAIDTSSPLTVGNGEFAFTADVTGLQTLNQSYRNPLLQTMSHWAWHTIPAAIAGIDPSKFTEQTVVVNNHTSHYPVSAGQPPALVAYLRSNPHRLNLARLFLRRGVASTAPAIGAAELSQINQTLDVWEGVLHSRFALDGETVAVETAVHPDVDEVALRVCSPLLASGALAIGLAFPYGDTAMSGGSDWGADPSRHTSELVTKPKECETTPVLRHRLDNTSYDLRLRLHASGGAGGGASCVQLRAVKGIPHSWTLALSSLAMHAGGSVGADACIEVGAWFLPTPTQQHVEAGAPSVSEALDASATHWPRAWREGAALELVGSTAPGALELERRLVLSQFVMMTQEAGSNPPQVRSPLMTLDDP